MRSASFFTCTLALVLLTAATAHAQDAAITLKLSVAKAKYQPGELAAFTLVVTNTSDKAVTLDTKPAKFLNNGLAALATGEMLRRVEVKDGKDTLHEPGMVSFGGIEPGVMVREETLQLGPKATKTITFAAKVEAARLLFDDPASPGLKTFGTRLSRQAYAFPLGKERLTLRLIYNRGGTKATSNDVTLEIERGAEK